MEKLILGFDIKKLKFLELFENKMGASKNWKNLLETNHKSNLIKLGHDVTKSPQFQIYYKSLIKTLPLNFNKKIFFQKHPTFRVGLPNERTTAFHTDNISSGHGQNIQNFWIPLNNLNKFNTLWLLDKEKTKTIIDKFRINKLPIEELDKLSKNIAKPCVLNYGQLVKFSNDNLHGTVFNKSKDLRFSFDFRVLNGDLNSGIKNLEDSFQALEKQEKEEYKDVISLVYTNHKANHISHDAQRYLINEFCERNNYKPLIEGAEWYNLNHYPVLEDLIKNHSDVPIVFFSKASLNFNLKKTKNIINKLKKHKPGVFFAFENERL